MHTSMKYITSECANRRFSTVYVIMRLLVALWSV